MHHLLYTFMYFVLTIIFSLFSILINTLISTYEFYFCFQSSPPSHLVGRVSEWLCGAELLPGKTTSTISGPITQSFLFQQLSTGDLCTCMHGVYIEICISHKRTKNHFQSRIFIYFSFALELRLILNLTTSSED